MRETGNPGKTLAGKILKGAATIAMPGLMVPLAIANKQAEKREAAAAEVQAEMSNTNPISQVANLSTPLTPSATPVEYPEGPEGGFDQPTSGWDADAEAVSEAVNATEEEGGYELGTITEEGDSGNGEEEVYEESFFGKATTPEQKKKNQKTLLMSLISLVLLCLLVWFITRYIKK